ncbi:MAG: hypothetical protein NTV21_14850 [Planctomycetota bacterium]|nr:hypothetical protein [Planctomycetota bacterium]
MKHKLVALFACVTLAFPLTAQQSAPVVTEELRRAVAELRNVPEDLPEEEIEERTTRIDAAWDTLIAAKDAGVVALLEEAAKLDAAKEQDDRFKLGAAAVIWQIGHFDRVAEVARLWHSAQLLNPYAYVFYTALEAASDGDERALPLLTELLRDQKGDVFLEMHSMDVTWPETHRFLWGPMGRKAVPALEKVLETEKDPVALSSAITLLASCFDTAALPRIRAIARDREHGARIAALGALGTFGHPDDFELLVGALPGLEAQDCAKVLLFLAYYEDVRAVPHIVPLTKHADLDVRRNAIGALSRLVTVDGLEAFAEALKSEKDAETRRAFQSGPSILRQVSVKWKDYVQLDRDARQKTLDSARAKDALSWKPTPEGKALSRDELEGAIRHWIEAGRLNDDESKFEASHVLSQVTPADLPLLLDARGRLYRRLSDECLYEVFEIDETLVRVMRATYRREPGLCDQAQPLESKQGK